MHCQLPVGLPLLRDAHLLPLPIQAQGWAAHCLRVPALAAACGATPSPGILFRSKHSCCQCALLQLLEAAMQLVAMLRAKEVDR